MRKNAVLVCVVIALSFRLTGAFSDDESSVNFEEDRVKWLYPIAIPKSSSREVEESAAHLAKILKMPKFVQKTNANPVCCFWIEVGKWKPNPSEPGFLIMIQPGGAQILASDQTQLDLAIDRIESSVEIKDERAFLPVGIMTNYAVIEAK